MTKNKKEFEKYLNALYADCYSEEQAVDLFKYLTSKNRKNCRTTIKNIRSAHNNHTLGTLLRKYDSNAFEVSFNDFNRGK